MTNRYDVLDLAAVDLFWSLEIDGVPAASGELDLPALEPESPR